MSETVQIEDPVDVICSLKAAVAALECEYKMNRQKAEARQKETRSSEPPMFIMIPLEHERHRDNATTPKDRIRAKQKRRCSDDVNSITSIDCRGKTSLRRSSKCDEGKGPTMRGGVLHNRCGCIHRDGLQDFCPLTECQGQPECMTKPWATCPPAKYYRAQFPDIWPSPATDRNNF